MFRSHTDKEASPLVPSLSWGCQSPENPDLEPAVSVTGCQLSFWGPVGLGDTATHSQTSKLSSIVLTGFLQESSVLQRVSGCPSPRLLRRRARVGTWKGTSRGLATFHPSPIARKLSLKGSSSEAWERPGLLTARKLCQMRRETESA